MQYAPAKFLGVRPDWLALHREEILEPEQPIVDAHHHLWDRPGWRYLLDEFLADANSGHRIVASVFVQCLAMYRKDGPPALRPVGETEFANGMAAMSASGQYGATRVCDGIVGYADLRLVDDLDAVLDAHAAHGGQRFKAIRQMCAWDDNPDVVNPENGAQPGMLSDPRFLKGLAALAPRGLRFEACVFHPQLPELVALARAFPATRMVLNHIGMPIRIGDHAKQPDETFKTWAAHIKLLASCDNMVVKLGGMGMRVGAWGFANHPAPLPSERVAEAMRPWVHTCIEHFGAERCMFESNFPVDKGSYSYATCWNAFKRLAQGASAAEKRQLFHDTAAAFYGLQGA